MNLYSPVVKLAPKIQAIPIILAQEKLSCGHFYHYAKNTSKSINMKDIAILISALKFLKNQKLISLNLLLICLFNPFFYSAQTGGPGGVGSNQPVFNIDKFIQKVTAYYQDPNNPIAGYQLVFNKDGNLYYSEAGGASIYEEDNGVGDIPMLNTTRQNISSVSKFITTLVLANVLEEYGIDWDEPIFNYLHSTMVATMAPQHNNPQSPCYLTFEKLIRHQSCLDFSATSSGPNPNNADMQAYLSTDSINLSFPEDNLQNVFDYNDYRNGNFILTRILISNIWAINNIGFNINAPNADPQLIELQSAEYYYDLIDEYIYSPLGITAPISHSSLEAFHQGSIAPRAHQFPFNKDSLTCGVNLGWKAENPSAPNSAGGSGIVLNSLELAEILAHFNNNSGTIISNVQRDYILDNDLGMTEESAANCQTSFGKFYYKNGTRGPGCPGGSAPNSIKRATMSFIAAYPNNVELVMLTNSRIDFRFDSANEWENSWETECNAFTHVTAEGSVHLNRSEIDNDFLNMQANKLLFITNDFTRSQQLSPSPVAAFYDNDKWWVYNQDGSAMTTGKRFNILTYEEDYPLAFQHTHIPNINGSAPHVSVIDHPKLNGNPDAKLLVTQNFGGPGGVLNNHSIGVWFNGSNWTIFNQDFSPMVSGAMFNVLFDHPELFTENISAPFGSFFGISNTDIPDQEASQTLFTTNALSPNGQFNNSEVGVWHTNDQWFLYNENGNFFLGGAKMNVLKLEDCECCGDTPNNTANLVYDWCRATNSASCYGNHDTIACAEDFVLFEPILYDQCRTYEPNFNYSILGTINGLPRYATQYTLLYEGLPTWDSFYTSILDTIPPDIIGVPNDTVVNCSIPPVPEVIVASDNCSINIVPIFEEFIEGADCDFKITRTYTAVDSVGNEAIKSYCIYSGSYADQDNDGANLFEDCDDNDPTIFPGANELCDGMDNDCDSQIDEQCLDCIAANFMNTPTGLFEFQNGANSTTRLKWNHYSDASDACILKGATSDGTTNTGPFGQVLIQGALIEGDMNGHDFSAALAPDQNYELFNPATFPISLSNNLIPGATYMWQVRCGCIIDPSIPYPDKLFSNNIHLSPWSEFDFFDNPALSAFQQNGELEINKKVLNKKAITQISPNPSKGEIWFSRGEWEKEVLIEIFELQGRKIYSEQFSGLPHSISIENFNSGMHFIKIISQKRKEVQKIILKN